LFPYLIQKNWN